MFPTDFPLGDGLVPDFVLRNHALMCMHKNHRGEEYKDDLCFFRCLAYPQEERVPALVDQWHAFSADSDQIHLYMMPELEKCFQKNINVHELVVVPRYLSLGHYDEDGHLNVWENHLSLILDFEKYARKYTCAFCHKMFERKFNWQGHQKVCSGLKKLDYVGGIYQPSPSFSEEMRDRVGHKPFFPWFIVYDFEAMLLPQQSHQGSIKWQTRHHLISVSVAMLPLIENPSV